jgi:flavin reductase (DIM6/NTAB) family NADH-FMN oxidoreductase RutF
MAEDAELRELMRRFPSGVAVVTIDLEGEQLGLTVGSLVSLSLAPPLVGVSVAKEAAMHELLRRAGGFSVSLLAVGQEHVAQHFARGVPPFAHWQGVPVREGEGPPLIEGALGWLHCRVSGEHDAGDHTLFVGEVVATELGTPNPPLLYLDGRYRNA